MPQQPTPGGGPNQTLLELIYALKGLAQTVEFFHQDLSRKLDEEYRARTRELDKIRDILAKSSQSISVMPITFSDRAEKLINKLKEDVGEKLRDVEDAVIEVRNKLEGYSRTAERAISQSELVEQAIAQKTESKGDITGRIELTKDGEVKMVFNSKVLKKVWIAVVILAAGGGAYGLKEIIFALMGL